MKLTVVTVTQYTWMNLLVFKIAIRDKHKRYAKICDYENNQIAKHCWKEDHNCRWDRKQVTERERKLIPRKIKETIHSLKNSKYFNKIC